MSPRDAYRSDLAAAYARIAELERQVRTWTDGSYLRGELVSARARIVELERRLREQTGVDEYDDPWVRALEDKRRRLMADAHGARARAPGLYLFSLAVFLLPLFFPVWKSEMSPSILALALLFGPMAAAIFRHAESEGLRRAIEDVDLKLAEARSGLRRAQLAERGCTRVRVESNAAPANAEPAVATLRKESERLRVVR